MPNKYLLLFLFVSALLTGCFENDTLTEPQIVTDGETLDLRLFEYTDLDLYTYFNDSLVTNTLSTFTLGHHQDNYRGTINASPYLQFGITSSTQVEDAAKLDSTVLVLFYETYHYDTLPGFDVNVHELLEELEVDDDDNIYSYQSFDYNDTPIATQAMRVVPHRDSLTITLPQDFSQMLFEQGKGKNSIFESTDDLEEVFKGLVLQTLDNSPLVSFTESSYIGFYYRIPSDLDEGNKILKLSVENGSGKFTHLDIDRSSQFYTSTETYQNIPIDESNGVVMADQIMGASIRMELPNIHELLEIADDYFITSASLRLPLKPNTYDRYFNTPITTVNVWIVDKKNLFLYNLGSATLTSWDEQFQEKTYYEIPIKEFIDYKLGQDIHNEDALWISVPSSTGITTSGLMLSSISDEQKIKIDITFLPLN
ncbi:DUF4270 family protein [Echinicola sp. 20G]|uniref:DUF4270 family protein n=1 Tax=Echinicola sp. 20G TaxID=2781961 RepID=UPI001910765B|nr:DUF4270 family protein [Echinicola sp. 20G]